MEKMQFDSGMRTYRVNGGGTLSFNPADPNLYVRFQTAMERLNVIGAKLCRETEDFAVFMHQADKELKDLLSWVFPGNDFEKILCGVNLLAVTKRGKTVFENFLDALEPILCEGAESCAERYAAMAESHRHTVC